MTTLSERLAKLQAELDHLNKEILDAEKGSNANEPDFGGILEPLDVGDLARLALHVNCAIRFRYTAGTRSGIVRVASPFAISEDGAFMRCFDHTIGAVRSYRLGRVADATLVADPRFEEALRIAGLTD